MLPLSYLSWLHTACCNQMLGGTVAKMTSSQVTSTLRRAKGLDVSC